MFFICSKGFKIDFQNRKWKYLNRKKNYSGNGIIFSTSWPLIKKLILQSVSHFYQGVRIRIFKQEMEIFKQDMDLILHFQVSDQKNFFYKMFLMFTKELERGN